MNENNEALEQIALALSSIAASLRVAVCFEIDSLTCENDGIVRWKGDDVHGHFNEELIKVFKMTSPCVFVDGS